MTDFPRGWTLSTGQSIGANAVLTIPAVAGVVHVLDSVTAIMQCTAAFTGGASLLTLTSSDGVYTGLLLADLALAGGSTASDSASLSGLDLAAGPGASLTLTLNGGAANLALVIIAQGHDI